MYINGIEIAVFVLHTDKNLFAPICMEAYACCKACLQSAGKILRHFPVYDRQPILVRPTRMASTIIREKPLDVYRKFKDL